MSEPNRENAAVQSERSPAISALPVTAQPRGGAAIYLSWGGEIFGPSTREEVVAGIRTSWFEQSALYWHEGLDEWKPVYEFPVSTQSAARNRQHLVPAEVPAAPALPTATRTAKHQRSRPPRSRISKPRSQKLDRRGRAIALGFALLAVLLTVGILLLLMLV